MDLHLHCNSNRCRQILTKDSVVTNCSHIFCVDWSPFLRGKWWVGAESSANKLFTESRICPLCDTQLLEPDVPLPQLRAYI